MTKEPDLIHIAADALWRMIPKGCGATLTLDGRKLSLMSKRHVNHGPDEMVLYFRHWKYKPGTVIVTSRKKEPVNLHISDPRFFEKAMDMINKFLT
jgi:hypothetical protein